jgi:hypothetical protein
VAKLAQVAHAQQQGYQAQEQQKKYCGLGGRLLSLGGMGKGLRMSSYQHGC